MHASVVGVGVGVGVVVVDDVVEDVVLVVVVNVVGVTVMRHEQADDTLEAGYCET